MLQPSQLPEIRVTVHERLQDLDLALTQATKRKMDCFAADSPDVVTRPVGESITVSLESFHGLMSAVKFKTCSGNVSVSKGERE